MPYLRNPDLLQNLGLTSLTCPETSLPYAYNTSSRSSRVYLSIEEETSTSKKHVISNTFNCCTYVPKACRSKSCVNRSRKETLCDLETGWASGRDSVNCKNKRCRRTRCFGLPAP